MNVVFLSPHFPPNWWRFVRGLKDVGATTLAIADQNWEVLRPELREALDDYFRVDDLANYDQLTRAMGFFIHRHGRIGRLDSLNEHWLETEARLRTDFNVQGINKNTIGAIKRKSLMKSRFLGAGLAAARGKVCKTPAQLNRFIAEVGLPVVAKPDVGVGAAKTYKDWAYVANLPGLKSRIQLGTVPEPFIDQGDFGCADVGVPHVLAPGGQLRERHRWDGTAAPGLGLPPSGPAEWTGTFQLWGRDSEPGAARSEFTKDPIVVRLPVEIRSARDPRALSAGQAMDVALLVPAFRALLEANPSIQDWDMPITTRFDVPTGAWQIGLKTNKGKSVVVVVEGDTARVIDVVER